MTLRLFLIGSEGVFAVHFPRQTSSPVSWRPFSDESEVSIMKRKQKRAGLFRKENGDRLYRELPPGFDFEIFREEERERRDMQLWFGITPEEADVLFPGTQPFNPHKPLPRAPRKRLK